MRSPRPVRLAGLLAVVATVLALLPATAQARAVDESWAVGDRATIDVVGRGYGHGHGMSQYGAEGAARNGLDAEEIVGFYYPGTRLGKVFGTISVLISSDTTDDLVVEARRGLRVRDVAAGRTWVLPDNGATRWRLVVNSRGRVAVHYHRGFWRFWRFLSGEGEFHAAGAPVGLVTPSGTASYRGRLRAAAPSAGSRDRDTVNVVWIETYLRGVVPREMPASWRPAAVQAQAIAARTYAAYERQHPRASHYQVCDTSSCQVYGGVADEHPDSDAAVRATRTRALYHANRPAFTQFHASSGGWTSAGSMPYLPAQEDPYDGFEGNPRHAWTLTIGAAALERAFPAVGNLTRLRVTERTGGGDLGGRVGSVTVIGSRGRARVTGVEMRSRLGLRSDWFTFRVR